MSKSSQKGFVPILGLMLILVIAGGLVVGVYLVQRQTNLLPKAASSSMPRLPETSSLSCYPAHPEQVINPDYSGTNLKGFSDHWQAASGSAKYDSNYDINPKNKGKIDIFDLILFTKNLHCQGSASPTPSASCRPRPACLDANPPCYLTPPAGGWCPSSL